MRAPYNWTCILLMYPIQNPDNSINHCLKWVAGSKRSGQRRRNFQRRIQHSIITWTNHEGRKKQQLLYIPMNLASFTPYISKIGTYQIARIFNSYLTDRPKLQIQEFRLYTRIHRSVHQDTGEKYQVTIALIATHCYDSRETMGDELIIWWWTDTMV